MPTPASPQLRFLLRGSSLLLVLLALWWWVLLSPMLAGMRLSTGALLWLLPGGRSASGVTVEPNGDWVLRVPIPESLANGDAVQRAYGRAPGTPRALVRSFKLGIADRIPTFFTLGFPLFWALMLAAPRMPRLWRAVAGGTVLLAVLAQISLLLYTAYSIETTLRLATSALAVTLWSAAEYLNVNVVPYVAPIVIAPWLHTGLRAQIFSWNAASAPVAAPESAPLGEADKPRRGRYRGRK
jgi:hypothetical protein